MSALILVAAMSLTVRTNAADTQDQEPKAISNPKIADFGWIAGYWQGDALGGKFEETWNPPMGNSMVGMFKLVKDSEVAFYEILTIVEENDSVILRLKHFDNQLNGWEAKDKSVEFPFVSVSKLEAVFDGLKFVKVNKDTMHIFVKTKEGESTNEMKFVCKRKVAIATTDAADK